MVTKLPVQSGSDREGKSHLYLADLDALLPGEIWHGIVPRWPALCALQAGVGYNIWTGRQLPDRHVVACGILDTKLIIHLVQKHK